jgi:hypothetical protein
VRDLARGLFEYRRQLETLATGLGSGASAGDEAVTELRSAIECLLCDHFDPLVRGLLGALSGPAGQLAMAVQNLWGAERLLLSLASELPHSPLEDAMLDGEIEMDEPTEMRVTISAVLEDQLGLAVENLLHAALYQRPR